MGKRHPFTVIATIALALALGACAVAVGAAKDPVGDHSRDAGEMNRAAVFSAEDHSLDQIESQRSVYSPRAKNWDALHRGHPRPVPAIGTAPVIVPDSWDEIHREHRRVTVTTTNLQPLQALRDLTGGGR